MSLSTSKKSDMSNQKSQRIQVFVRTRPFNAAEAHSHNVIELCNEKKEIRIRHGKTINRAFAFDGVFGADTKQVQVYKAVVGPLIQEVLMGYNCTVFAYGQTSTGKTYTMEGGRTNMDCEWDKDPSAGIIPRSLHQLFEELHKEENVEFSVHVSFLELYNEELFDLLSPNDMQHLPRLKLFEDVNRKGSVVIQGLEEVKVNSKDEVYVILEQGTQRRQTAATLLNASSSRSHTIFSITVHIKENTIDGEELLKIGKLNLVDLAGSENIGRSGASQKAAREAGNINQSLLTLGRVITSLVEKHPHVPYRESKLTRLLQDSLGGHTKTSIIATVSPASSNIDETISTLDYAQRAKCITIKPEINQKTTKRALIQLYTEEITKLKNDLDATRNKNGVYLHPDNYSDMQKKIEDLTATVEKLTEDGEDEKKKNTSLEDRLKECESKLEKMTSKWNKADNKCSRLTKRLEQKTKSLRITQQALREAVKKQDENQYIINIQSKTEEKLASQAEEVLQSADESAKDAAALHDKISRKTDVEKSNEAQSEKFCSNLKGKLSKMNTILTKMAEQQKENLHSVSTNISDVLALCNKYHQDFINIDNTESCLGNFSSNFNRQINSNMELFSANHENHTKFFSFNMEKVEDLKNLNTKLLNELNTLQAKDSTVRHNFISKISNLKESLVKIQDQTNSKIKELEMQLNFSSETHQSHTHELIDQFREFCTVLKADYNEGLQKQTSLRYAKHNEYQQEMEKEVYKLRSELIIAKEKLANIDVIVAKIDDIRKTDHQDEKRQCSEIRELNDRCCKRIKLEETKLNDKINSWDEQETVKRNQLEKFSQEANNEEETNKNQITEDCTSIMQECENEMPYFKACYETSKGLVTKQEEYLITVNNKTAEENETLVHNWNKYQRHVEEFKNITVEQLRDMESKINTHKEHFSTSQQHAEAIVNVANELTNTTSTINKEFVKRDAEIQNFFSDTLKKDKSTGLTPIRKDYTYPRDFVATSPPERLLKRYHEELCVNEVSAAKLSLDLSSDNSFESSLEVPSKDCTSSDEGHWSCSNPSQGKSGFSSEGVRNKENIQSVARKPSKLPRRKSINKKTFPKPRSTFTRKPLTSSNCSQL